jgi:putative oxidoreductase
MTDLALLAARMFLGLAIAAHGAQKAFGWFGGYGLKGTGGFFETLGYKPGVLFAALASGGEIFGGLLTALGLGGPLGPALIVLVMIVAVGSLHFKNGFFAAKNGFELNAFYIAAAVALGFSGPGGWSLDGLLNIGRVTAQVDAVVLGAGALIALGNLSLRRIPQAAGAGRS